MIEFSLFIYCFLLIHKNNCLVDTPFSMKYVVGLLDICLYGIDAFRLYITYRSYILNKKIKYYINKKYTF